MITVEASAGAIAGSLRGNKPPIIGRIEDDFLFLDPRTVLPEERETVCEATPNARRFDFCSITREHRESNRDGLRKSVNFQS